MEHQTASFPVSRRTARCIVMLAITALSLLAASAPLQAEPSGREIAGKLIGNVVQIRSRWGGRPQAGGFGFIVGERSGELYIATANHVVRGGGPDEIDRAPSVIFEHRQDMSYPGRLLESSSTAADLAVIAVQTANTVSDFKWVREALSASETVAGMEVWFIGLEREWKVANRAGTVSNVINRQRRHYSGMAISVGDLRVAAGTSGAPLIAKEGIVGMIVSDSSSRDVEAIPIETIEEQIKQWKLPWDLTITSPQQNCDRLAASPYDNNRPAGVSGTPIDQIKPEAAIGACLGAVILYGSKIPRFVFQLGRAAEAAKSVEPAENGYDRAVKKGYPAAQASLGLLYEQQGREKEAADLYRAAAAQGDPVGQTHLGIMHRDGVGGVIKDDEAAVDLYKRAEKQGYPVAISALAWMYEQGRGVPRSESEAERLYREAAGKGDAYAQRALTRLGQ